MPRRSLILLSLSVVPACVEGPAPRPSLPDEPASTVDSAAGHNASNAHATDADNTSQVHETSQSDAGVAVPSEDAAALLDAAASPDMVAPGVVCAGRVCDVFATCDGEAELQCTCAPGLAGDGERCADLDECQREQPVCGSNATCRNAFGGYSCDCNKDYSWNGEACVADTPCQDSPCANAATCSDVDGALACTCDEGSFGNGFYCAPQDACADAPCGEAGECNTVAGGDRGFVCACRLGFSGATDCSACGDVLVLEDEELERAVRRQLGRTDDDASPISVAELADYSTLNASNSTVTDLAGLECWSTLRVLDVSYNEELTTDGAKALSGLNQLTELRLDCTQVTDLSRLLGHPRLNTLSANVLNCLEPALLEDMAMLGSLAQLEWLDLRGQKVSEGSFLTQLRNLRSLWFGHNALRSLADLAPLPLLRELDVSFNQLSTLDDLDRFPRLQYLNVSNNELESLKATEGLPALRTLSASDNRIGSLPNWQDSGELREVNVSYNQVASVEPLADLAQVTWVNVAGNAITTLSPLVDGALRGAVVIAGNPLPCASEAAHLAALRSLGVDVQGECVP